MAESVEASKARLRFHKGPPMKDDNTHSTGRLVVPVFVDMLHPLFQEIETSESFVQLKIFLLHMAVHGFWTNIIYTSSPNYASKN